ncbi:MAG: branched-chain amino acid ABC transporter permease [Desulfuromonadaceae bacterium]
MKIIKMLVLVAVAGAVGLCLPLLITSATVLSLMTQAVIYAIGTLGVGFLLRQNGHVSFGNAAFYGFSGYGIVLCSRYFGVSTGPAILIVIGLTGLFAFGVGLIIVRTPGIAFAMITLAIGQVFYILMAKARGFTGGVDGLVVEQSEKIFGLPSVLFGKPGSMFVICWLTLVFVMFLLTLLLRSRFGTLTVAIRENEERTRFIGFTTLVPRAAIYTISAMICAIAGTLSSLYSAFVSPDSLHWSLSGSFLVSALLGGTSLLSGTVIGAVVFFLLKDVLSEVTTHWMSIIGVCLIAVMVFWPEGISGGLSRGAKKLKALRGGE